VKSKECRTLKCPAWPVGWEKQGWQSPLVRSFGLNALPTFWIVDRAGQALCDALVLPEDTPGLLNWVGANEKLAKEVLPKAVKGMIERLGHALHAVQDPALVARLVRQQVPLELCLSSNLRTGCCVDLASHPLRSYFDAGALVTLNTDDPEMFQTTLVGEYRLAQEAFGFSDEELRTLAANSFRASWLPVERKRELLSLL
jgi:adenosine deaminase